MNRKIILATALLLAAWTAPALAAPINVNTGEPPLANSMGHQRYDVLRSDRRLRSKLGEAAEWLRTVRGVGYRIKDPAAD